jgi:hypothetical protein
MIEQHDSSLTISFPSPEAAAAFKGYLETLIALVKVVPSLLAPDSSVPPSENPQLDSPAPTRSQHVVLTPERQEQLFNQRQNGQSTRQRIQNAQTTLRDGVLPFSRPGETPAPSGQQSPRQRALAEGGFADGAAQPLALRPQKADDPPAVPAKTRLRPSPSYQPPSKS